MVDYTDLSDVIVDGDVVASRKLKGGQQAINEGEAVLLNASNEGEAVLLNASGKIPSEFIDSNVDLSDYVTTAGLDSTLESYVTDSELDQKLAGTSTGQAYARVWRGMVTGTGSSISLNATHNLGVLPSVTIYKNGKLYFTDISVTETDVTLIFSTAPGIDDVFSLVVIG